MRRPRIEDFSDMEEILNPDGSFRGYKSSNFQNAMNDYNRDERKRFIQMLLGELDDSPMSDPQIGDMSENAPDASMLIDLIADKNLRKFEVNQLVAFLTLRRLTQQSRNQVIKKVLEDEEKEKEALGLIKQETEQRNER